MPEKEAEVKKPNMKTVPLSDLVAFKKSANKRERELEGQLSKLKQQLEDIRAEMDFAGQDVSDDEVYTQRKKELLAVKRKLDEDAEALKTNRTELDEELRSVRVKGLVAEYATRGFHLDIDELMTEKDPEVLARDRYIDFLESNPKEAEPAKETDMPGQGEATPAKQVFENENIGVTKLLPHQMVKPDGTPDRDKLAEFRMQHLKT